ncbi:MAG TPA: hypothetical protein VKE22_11725 [Haliangiales bacterium]|nr:hypothetical protein [Haliangiales bacterium]
MIRRAMRGAPLTMAVMTTMLALAACAKSPRTRCELACRAEAECAEKLELTDNDYSECAQSCAALEGDSRAHALVEQHLQCVAAARSCEEILACAQRTPARTRGKPRSPLDVERTATGLRARARRDVEVFADGGALGAFAAGQELDVPRGTTRLVVRTGDAVYTVRIAEPAPPRAAPAVRRVVLGPFGAAAEVDP